MKRLMLVFTAVLVFVSVLSFNTAVAGDKPKADSASAELQRPQFVKDFVKTFIQAGNSYFELLGWGTAKFRDDTTNMIVLWVANRNSDGLVTFTFSKPLKESWLAGLNQLKDSLGRSWFAKGNKVETSNEPYFASSNWDAPPRQVMEWAIVRFDLKLWVKDMQIKETID